MPEQFCHPKLGLVFQAFGGAHEQDLAGEERLNFFEQAAAVLRRHDADHNFAVQKRRAQIAGDGDGVGDFVVR